MLLVISLAAPGSRCRFLHRNTHVALGSRLLQYVPIASRSITHIRPRCLSGAHSPSSVHSTTTRPNHKTKANGSIWRPSLRAAHTLPKPSFPTEASPEDAQAIFAVYEGIGEQNEEEGPSAWEPDVFRPLPSRRTLKAQRRSRADTVIHSIPDGARDMYWITPAGKTDLSYTSPAPRKPGGLPRRDLRKLPPKSVRRPQEPVSLYSILSRRLRSIAQTPHVKDKLDRQEAALLKSKGYSSESLDLWATCLLTEKSVVASGVFGRDHQVPPFFLVLLFFRRKRIKTAALGAAMRHVSARLQVEPIEWTALQVLVIRLLRHARVIWPESIPWIASLFCAEAGRIYNQLMNTTSCSSKILPSLTRFCNMLLWLITLPASEHPMLASIYQEKAQFLILKFMASCDPALTVTRLGFRGAALNQLKRNKTAQEKEWASLKGPSWPPWKENRNAMDEGKGYEFGASRASRILHRLYEAGYEGRTWEGIAEVYAGWDTDSSPTIQTRSFLARATCKERSFGSNSLLWAARIRTTRTRREAWACFLAHEESNAPSSPEVYMAMFEKLHFPEMQSGQLKVEPEATELDGISEPDLLPGDMKEVLPDPKSPLHLVYLREPIPTYDQLYHKMRKKGVRPSGRLLAFLLDTLPDFSTCLSLLEAAQDEFDGGVRYLLQGSLTDKYTISPLRGYFMGSFIRFLCRFGHFSQPPPDHPSHISREEHELRFKLDRSYLLDYAYALLMHMRPKVRSAWTEYMQKVIFRHNMRRRTSHAVAQYVMLRRLFESMDEADIDPDDVQFQLLCNVANHAAQVAHKGNLTNKDTRYVLSTAAPLLRTVFHNLVCANIDPSSTDLFGPKEDTLPPHVPNPTALHALVRALGTLRDYEGLYSFSSWITTYNTEVTARANAQRGGSKVLYRTIVALRSALEGTLCENPHDGAPQEIIELVKAQIEGVEGWVWPPGRHINLYTKSGSRGRSASHVPHSN